MQNHYNVLYREEEREMIPSLKVMMPDVGKVR
jgi:aryl-alcohol dehydrogenase-like predicted oxidoreductase